MAEDSASVLPRLLEILEESRKLGARGAELLRSQSQTTQATCKGAGEITTSHSESLQTRLIVYLDKGRSHSLSLPDLEPAKVTSRLKQGLARAVKARPNPQAGPAERYDIPDRGLGIDDPRYPKVDDEARRDVLEANRASLANTPCTLLEAQYTDALHQRTFASTRGVHATERSTEYQLILTARHRASGHSLTNTSSAHNFAHVASIPHGKGLVRALEAMSGKKGVVPGPLPLVLSPRVIAWILEQIMPAFAADVVAKGASFLNALGEEPIGSRRFHVIDDSSLPGGDRTVAFDDRGVPPVPVSVIREGKLGGLYHSPETARRAETRPTGHVQGTRIRPGNLVVRHGNRSRTQMLSEVPASIHVLHLSGSIDPTNGMMKAKGPGLLLEKGQVVGCISELKIHLPVVDLLRAVKEISSNQQRFGAVDCATTLTHPIDLS
jgi:predicted Zn-dependent protease